jgi:hypothetical protein
MQTPIGDDSYWNRKTQIVVEFAVQLRRRLPKTWVFWVYANSVATFTQSYRDIAEAVKMPGRDDLKTDTLELVSRWMKDERNGPWLMIVDNNDDSKLLFSPLELVGTDHTHSGHSTAPAHATILHAALTFLCRDADCGMLYRTSRLYPAHGEWECNCHDQGSSGRLTTLRSKAEH